MTDTKYQTLPEKFTNIHHGYDFTLVKRQGDIALYEARWIDGTTIQGYVVVRVLRGCPDRERLPYSPSLIQFYKPEEWDRAKGGFARSLAQYSKHNETGHSPSRILEVA